MTNFIRPTNARQRGGKLRSFLLSFLVAAMVFVDERNPSGEAVFLIF